MKLSLDTGVPIARQQKILDIIRANPLGSYIFTGPPGVGKTTMFREVERLARAAQPKNFALYSRTAMQYQRDSTALAKGERVSVVQPHCFEQDANYKIRWGVFLDDIDKISGSDFIRLQLFGLLDSAVQERNPSTQVVLTTNMNKAEFAKFFGDAINWRITKYCHWVPMERGL